MNPLLNMMNRTATGGSMNMMKRYEEFRKMFPAGANPQDILSDLISTGKVSSDQVEQAKQIVRQFGLK